MNSRRLLLFHRPIRLTILVYLLCVTHVAIAQDDPKVSEVLTELGKPVSVAIQPETEALFIGDIASGRIVKLPSINDATAPVTAIQGLSNEAATLSITFIDQSKLAVVYGTQASVFKVSESTVSDAKHALWTVTTVATTTSPSLTGFDSVVAGFGSLYWTTTGDKNYWLATMSESGKEKAARRWLALGDSIEDDSIEGAPQKSGLTLSATTFAPDGHLLVAANDPSNKNSTLYFVGTEQKKIRASFKIAQPGIQALAYSPNSQRLYALFQSEVAPEADGLYKLVARKRNTECEARLVAKIEAASSMAFTNDGDLYVTSVADGGKLLRIAGLDPVATSKPKEPVTKSDK